MKASGFRISKPYKEVIGKFNGKTVSISRKTKCVAYGLEAREVPDDWQFMQITCMEPACAARHIFQRVRLCRDINFRKIASELVDKHGFEHSEDSQCHRDGWQCHGLSGNHLRFRKQLSDTSSIGFAVYIPHEDLTDEQVEAKASEIMRLIQA